MDLRGDGGGLDPSSADPTKGVENCPFKFKWLLIHCHGYHRFHIICAHFNSDGLGSSAKDGIRGGEKKPAEFSRHTQPAQKQDEQFAELLQCAAIPFNELYFIEYLPTQSNKALLQRAQTQVLINI